MIPAAGPFLVIGVGILLGAFLRRLGRFTSEAPRTLNVYVISVALPAVVLSQLPAFFHGWIYGAAQPSGALLFLPLIPWLIFGLAILGFGLLYRIGKIRRDQWGLLALAAGLGNTSFVGLPLIEALLGKEKIPHAILLDQLGTFLALSVAGTAWISAFKASGTRGGFQFRKFLRDILSFPPFLALIASIAWAVFGVFSGSPNGIQLMLERIAGTLVPVAMVSVGAQLAIDSHAFKRELRGLTLGLGYKMVLAPVFIAALSLVFFGTEDESFRVGVLEAAMAPMITATVLGIEAGFAPELGALMLGVGISLSLLTVPLWNQVLTSLGL